MLTRRFDLSATDHIREIKGIIYRYSVGHALLTVWPAMAWQTPPAVVI